MNGLEVCKRLRRDERTGGIPIILVSALGDETDRVIGLELGADDYITKPFGRRELVARLKAVRRRILGPQEARTIRRCGDLAIDQHRREVTFEGKAVAVTETEYRILQCFLSHPGRALSRVEILAAIHADEVAVNDRTIDVHVNIVRRKLGKGGRLIETVRG